MYSEDEFTTTENLRQHDKLARNGFSIKHVTQNISKPFFIFHKKLSQLLLCDAIPRQQQLEMF